MNRASVSMLNPSPGEELRAMDHVQLLGSDAQIRAAQS
jgi:hypothetical protein